MDKELEEAIEYTKYQIETGNLVRGYTDIYLLQEELKILLNYIENSIPKERVKEKIKKLEKYKDITLHGIGKLEGLYELLEGK